MIVAFSRSLPPALLALVVPPALSGCLSTAASVITAPVKVVGKAADWATTSQDEADRSRGRALRRREAQLGQLDRAYRTHSAECRRGSDRACEQARADYAEIQRVSPSVPYER